MTVPAKLASSPNAAASSFRVSSAAGAESITAATVASTYPLLAASESAVGVVMLTSFVFVKSAVPLTTRLFRVVVPVAAVTLPVRAPVTLPVTLPVRFPVTLPVTLPVRAPTKPVVAVTVVPLTVDGVVAPMGVELIEPPVMTALLETNVPLAVRVPVTVAVPVVRVDGLVPSSTI